MELVATEQQSEAWCAQVSQLFKIGSLTYEDVKQFSCCVEEALFRLAAHRDRALTYKMEEVSHALHSVLTHTHTDGTDRSWRCRCRSRRWTSCTWSRTRRAPC